MITPARMLLSLFFLCVLPSASLYAQHNSIATFKRKIQGLHTGSVSLQGTYTGAGLALHYSYYLRRTQSLSGTIGYVQHRVAGVSIYRTGIKAAYTYWTLNYKNRLFIGIQPGLAMNYYIIPHAESYDIQKSIAYSLTGRIALQYYVGSVGISLNAEKQYHLRSVLNHWTDTYALNLTFPLN